MYSAQWCKLNLFFLFLGKIPCNHGEKQLHSDGLHPGGLHDRPQDVLFVVLLGVDYMTVPANTTLIVLTCNDSRLHTPMYFFTGNLSFLDLWYPSVYTPKILLTCISEDKRISFAAV